MIKVDSYDVINGLQFYVISDLVVKWFGGGLLVNVDDGIVKVLIYNLKNGNKNNVGDVFIVFD